MCLANVTDICRLQAKAADYEGVNCRFWCFARQSPPVMLASVPGRLVVRVQTPARAHPAQPPVLGGAFLSLHGCRTCKEAACRIGCFSSSHGDEALIMGTIQIREQEQEPVSLAFQRS